MSRITTITALSAAILIALPGAAIAKGGGGERIDPATPAPTAAPCVTAVAKGGGIVRGGKLPTPAFQLTDCASADETVIPSYVDHASDAWNLGRDCGPDQSWTGAAVSLQAGKSAVITTSAVRSPCPGAERHLITVTFTTLDGEPVSGTGYFGWEDAHTV